MLKGLRVQEFNHWHTVAHAWVKAYRPNENSSNTSMSYYSRGSIIDFINVMIIENSNGKKCLDHFLQALYSNFMKIKEGLYLKRIQKRAELFVGKNLDEFYAKYIDGTEIPSYSKNFWTNWC